MSENWSDEDIKKANYHLYRVSSAGAHRVAFLSRVMEVNNTLETRKLKQSTNCVQDPVLLCTHTSFSHFSHQLGGFA